MIKLKTFLNLFLLLILVASCNTKGESYTRYTGYISVVETSIPDSALPGQTVPVYVKATAPNGCWSDLKIYLERSVLTDTLYGITATGLFESSNGLCTQVLITADTTFEFKPDSAGTYIFVTYSSDLQAVYDTVYVVDSVHVRNQHSR